MIRKGPAVRIFLPPVHRRVISFAFHGGQLYYRTKNHNVGKLMTQRLVLPARPFIRVLSNFANFRQKNGFVVLASQLGRGIYDAVVSKNILFPM